MDIDLPQDTTVSTREKKLLQDMRQRLANVDMQPQCGTCHERAFDLTIRRQTNECSRCHADKHENGKQWSNANNVNPRELRFTLCRRGTVARARANAFPFWMCPTVKPHRNIQIWVLNFFSPYLDSNLSLELTYD